MGSAQHLHPEPFTPLYSEAHVGLSCTWDLAQLSHPLDADPGLPALSTMVLNADGRKQLFWLVCL